MKLLNFFTLTIITASLSLVSCDTNQGTVTNTETEVVSVDTVDSSVSYDVNRKTIELVDTTGATVEYDIERRVVKRTVGVDTVTREMTQEEVEAYERGDYNTVDTEVSTDVETEEIEDIDG